jgi:hypothetical protein
MDEKAGLMRLCCPSGEAGTAGTLEEELSERSTGTCERDLAPSVRPLFGKNSESRKENIFSQIFSNMYIDHCCGSSIVSIKDPDAAF